MSDLIENLRELVHEHDDRCRHSDSDLIQTAIAEIEELRAKVAAIPPAVGYYTEVEPEYYFAKISDLIEHHSYFSGAVPETYELRPSRCYPTEHYAIVPTAVLDRREWADTEVIGPFASHDEARAEADRITAERRSEWEAAEGGGA